MMQKLKYDTTYDTIRNVKYSCKVKLKKMLQTIGDTECCFQIHRMNGTTYSPKTGNQGYGRGDLPTADLHRYNIYRYRSDCGANS